MLYIYFSFMFYNLLLSLLDLILDTKRLQAHQLIPIIIHTAMGVLITDSYHHQCLALKARQLIMMILVILSLTPSLTPPSPCTFLNLIIFWML